MSAEENYRVSGLPKPRPTAGPTGTWGLHLFLMSGKTFTFRGVTVETDNESQLTFSYAAASDGRQKTGTFQKSQLAGFSTFPED